MIQRKVKELIRKFKTNDPFLLADYCNIKLMYADLGHLGGFYQYYKRTKIIMINEALSSHEQREVCAHELGHALLHPKKNRFFLHRSTFQNCDKLEREANLFAACLLIQENDAREFLQQGVTINQISSITGVSSSLVEERMCLFMKENAKTEFQKEYTELQ